MLLRRQPKLWAPLGNKKERDREKKKKQEKKAKATAEEKEIEALSCNNNRSLHSTFPTSPTPILFPHSCLGLLPVASYLFLIVFKSSLAWVFFFFSFLFSIWKLYPATGITYRSCKFHSQTDLINKDSKSLSSSRLSYCWTLDLWR
jgi:hypothetical protein